MKITFILLFLLTAVSACTPTPDTTPSPPPFKIIAYVDNSIIVDQVPFEKLTHINYAFAIPNADGSVKPLGNRWKIEQLIEKANAKGVMVLISVGGWGHDETFETLAADPEAMALFVTELTTLVDDFGFNGIDMDWEYPDAGDSADRYTVLMTALGTEMRMRDKLLTAAVAAVGAHGDGVQTAVFSQVDFLNLMVYDKSNGDHASFSYAQESLAYWQQRGLPPEKTVLGVPFYGRPDWIPYHKLVAADPAAAQQDEIEYNGNIIYYNGIPAMQKKTKLAMESASGIMFWTLSYDTQDETSLLNTIYEGVKNNEQ